MLQKMPLLSFLHHKHNQKVFICIFSVCKTPQMKVVGLSKTDIVTNWSKSPTQLNKLKEGNVLCPRVVNNTNIPFWKR